MAGYFADAWVIAPEMPATELRDRFVKCAYKSSAYTDRRANGANKREMQGTAQL